MVYKFLLTLVRHGETVENRENKIQGQADTLLTDLGKQQAALVGTHLHHERYTYMYSSDLSRASNTAQAIVEANQVSTCKLVLDKRLRERSFGVMQGKSFRELQDMLKTSNTSFKSFTPEGGERIEQVTQRVASFFNSMCSMVLSTASGASTSDSSLSMETMENNGATSHQCGSEEEEREPGTSVSCDETDNESNSSLENDISILIVSHGLWLKEFIRVILDRYTGKRNEEISRLVQHVMSNTGVSKFMMSVSKAKGKMRVRCVECLVMNSSVHLHSSNDNLVTEAKYDGITDA